MAPPEVLSTQFFLGHGLGNDYLVFEADPNPPNAERAGEAATWLRTEAAVRAVCARGAGLGSDGIVVLLDRNPRDGVFPLIMINPDGSVFERSGNGLRVLGAYLLEEGLVPLEGDGSSHPFEVRTGGDVIRMLRHGPARGGVHDVEVAMGQARVEAPEGRGVQHPVLGEIRYIPVRTGNPHAVIFDEARRVGDAVASSARDEATSGADSDAERAITVLDGPDLQVRGRFIAEHPTIPGGTNVQWARILGPGRVAAGIWERGVGRTPASGTSACAVAVAGVATGRLAPGRVAVRMAGGTLEVGVTPTLEVTLRGPVQSVARGALTSGFVSGFRFEPESSEEVPQPEK
jgi:diaminopimelate epimerase